MDFLKILEHHVLDHPLGPVVQILGFPLPVTKHVTMLWASAGMLAVTLPLFARSWPLVPSGFRNMLEATVVFIRDEVVLPNTGEEGRPYLPYFLSVFFFILVAGLLGLVPGAATATGNISVTATLALCTFFLINFAGIRRFGVLQHFKNFIPHGIPWPVAILILPLEILGLLTRSFALCIRLFANMIAGHIVILAFLSLIFISGSFLIAPESVLAALGLELLEIFIVLLQAYIFTLLSAIFVGASLHPH
ncbi:MAG: F0F1 ATP synthase subunit A [Elusimicrobia bacterium]|nr:F0F1 ATP synthase subunit A [Candidatus Obscuribacterium magneticum]MCB4756361.1 F0F1 ATP synthase subunit A [Candidatus Obscuribacterium magneticum]